LIQLNVLSFAVREASVFIMHSATVIQAADSAVNILTL